MKLYRFSPISSYEELVRSVSHVHVESLALCKQTFGEYLPVVGSIAVFTHSEEEFAFLTELLETIAFAETPFNGKYHRLKTPITVDEGGVPSGTYTHLYIRRPDPYRSQVGDADLYLNPERYHAEKQRVSNGLVKGARVFPEARLDMIELYDFNSDVLAYVDSFSMDDTSTWSTT